jgi:hypothetical protein
LVKLGPTCICALVVEGPQQSHSSGDSISSKLCAQHHRLIGFEPTNTFAVARRDFPLGYHTGRFRAAKTPGVPGSDYV